MLVLDSGAVTTLAQRNQQALATVVALRREGLWPPVVPSIVLVESLTGTQRTDANVNRFLQTCQVVEPLPEWLARRAASLRAQARRGSAVDALVVATAEPGGNVLTGDVGDLRVLAANAVGVGVHRL